MAAIPKKILKGVAIIGTVPTLGFGLGYYKRLKQVAENRTAETRIFKISDIPMYNTARATDESIAIAPYPQNVVEEGIGEFRKVVQGVIRQCRESCEFVTDKLLIGKAHTEATIDYLQNDQNEFIRILAITLFGAGGIVVGYRGSKFRKALYASIGAGSMASLCYPVATVELTNRYYNGVVDFVYQTFAAPEQPLPVIENKLPLEQVSNEIVSEVKDEVSADIADVTDDQPADKVEETAAEETPAEETPAEETPAEETPAEETPAEETPVETSKPVLEGDPGQSNPEDTDMYSRRSS